MRRWTWTLGSLWLAAAACGGGASDSDGPGGSGGGMNASGGKAGSSGGTNSSSGGKGNGSGASASGAGGTPAGSGGAAGSPTGGMGGEGAGPKEIELEPGTCGVIRSIPLPELPFKHRVVGRDGNEKNRPGFVRRMNGAFVVGPWSADDGLEWHMDWLSVSDDGAKRVRYSVAPTRTGWPLGLYPMAGLSDLTWVEATSSSPTAYWGGVLLEGADDYSSTGVLLGSSVRVEMSSQRTGTSLDGERGLLAVGLGALQVAIFSKDGSLVGEAFESEMRGECFRHIATEHGNALLSGSRLLEFSASGEVVLDYDVEGASGCPEVALTEDGFGILSYHPDNLWRIHRVGHDGSATVEELPPSTDFGTPLAVAFLGDSALVVQIEEFGLLHRVRDGNVTPFIVPAALPWRSVSAEPGRLFLDIENPSDPEAVAREIVEIGCAD